MKNNLATLLDQLENHIPYSESTNFLVSQSTVGWQIEHSLLTINGIVGAVQKSNPKNYNWKFSFFKIIILATQKIPRGKAKAPKIVRPEGEISSETLGLSLSKVKENLMDWKDLDKNTHFPHPFFGILNKKETENFLALHTKHHLMIIDDILNKE